MHFFYFNHIRKKLKRILLHRWAGVVIALLYFFSESLMHRYIYHESWGESLLPGDTNELVMRGIIVFLIISFGAYIQQSGHRVRKVSAEITHILESTTDAYLAMGYDYRIKYVNHRARNLLKLTEPDLTGKNLWDIMPDAIGEFFKNINKVVVSRENTLFSSFYSAIGRWLEIHAYPFDDYIAFYFRDTTEQKLLLESNRRLNTIIGSASDGIITINQAGIMETFNESAESIFGYSHNEVIGKNISMLMADENEARHHDSYVHEYVTSGNSKIINIGPREVTAKRKDGTQFPMDLAVSEMEFSDQHYFIGIVRDITDRQKVRNKLEYLSSYDTLTDLPNRTLFHDRLSQAMKQAKRQQQIISLMFLDLDKFKNINDSLGHAAGDELLIKVAENLKACVRETDTVARLSGDEFAIILYPINKKTDSSIIAEKILSELKKPMMIKGKELAVTSSIGISFYPGDADSEESLLRCADIAMYHAKAGGRGAYVYFDNNMKMSASA